MAHPLTGQKKSRQHKERIRRSMLSRYAAIRAALGVQSIKDVYKDGHDAAAK